MRSKYLNKSFGNWECAFVGIRNVQGKKSKAPGKRNYFYVFERRTSDNKADKIIKLNSSEAAKVYRYETSVEELLEKRESKRSKKFIRQVNYNFD